jgi:diguanylate cyclase (GGDEF)-like protein
MNDSHRALRHIAGVLRGTQLVVLAAAMFAGTLLWREAKGFQQVDAWVEHSHEVIDAIDHARAATLRAGMWIRSLAVQPSQRAASEVRLSCQTALDEARRLQQLTVTDQEQQLRARRVDNELRVTVGWMSNATDIGEDSGTEPLLRVLRMRIDKDSSRNLREAFDDMALQEKDHLRQHIRMQAQHLERLRSLGLALGLLVVGALAWSVVYARRLVRVSHVNLNQLSASSLQDPLTGLANRRALVEAVGRMPADHPFAVIAFDLDHFKDVNDLHGHGAGDEVLRTVAARLQEQCRTHDIIARLGGDEFVVVLANVGDELRASSIAARIRLALREPLTIAGQEIQVGASLGIAMWGQDGSDFDQLLRAADVRSYEAMRAGRPQAGSSPTVVQLRAAV